MFREGGIAMSADLSDDALVELQDLYRKRCHNCYKRISVFLMCVSLFLFCVVAVIYNVLFEICRFFLTEESTALQPYASGDVSLFIIIILFLFFITPLLLTALLLVYDALAKERIEMYVKLLGLYKDSDIDKIACVYGLSKKRVIQDIRNHTYCDVRLLSLLNEYR